MLMLVPEYTQVAQPGALAFVVIVANSTNQELTAVNLASAHPARPFTAVLTLPTTILSNTLVHGVYTAELEQETTYGLVALLTYTRNGQTQSAIAHTAVTLQTASAALPDWALLLIGAGLGVLGGAGSEAIKGWLDTRRQTQQQAAQALGVLLPALAICIRAVEQNREAPLELWQEVYFKEGLHGALSRQSHQLDIVAQIPRLYASMREYNSNRQLVNRAELGAELQRVYTALEQMR